MSTVNNDDSAPHAIISGVLKEPLSISKEYSGLPPSSLAVPLNKASFTETGHQEEDDVASQDESSGGDGSLYLEPSNIPVSASGTPLRNAPVGSEGMSSKSVKILDSKAHEPYTCILTRAKSDWGLTIARSHIIPRSVKTQELRACEWMLGYDAGTFNIDSHYNVTFLKEDMHSTFDKGKWVLVPIEEERKMIFHSTDLRPIATRRNQRLKRVRGRYLQRHITSHCSFYTGFTFTQVYHRRKGVYTYKFVNIGFHCDIPIYTATGQVVSVDPNSTHPLLQSIKSHVHPFHVIIKAHQKFELWQPKPKDGPTLDIVNDIRTIRNLLNMPPALDEFLNYRRKDSDHTNMGPPSDTQSHQNGSSLGKRSSRDDDSHGAGTSSRRLRRHSHREPADGVPSLMDGHSSRESSTKPCNNECENEVRNWQVSLLEKFELSPPPVSIDDMEQTLSESVANSDITHWEPDWDTRYYDTKKFSSNDWALLRNQCYLTGSQ